MKRRGGVAVTFFALALVAACTTKPRGEVTKPDSVDAASGAGASAVQVPVPVPAASAAEDAGEGDAEAPADPPSTAWTDPEQIAGLVRDCGYTPPDVVRPKDAKPFAFEGSALSCTFGLFPQVCADDPCVDEQIEVCHVGCERSCEGCARTCQASCKTCKASCKKGDDTCARTCATSCAGCRQECVGAKDRCSSGACTKRYAECNKELRARLEKNGCLAACKSFFKCLDTCDDDKTNKCHSACEKKLAACTGRSRQVCQYNGRILGAIEDN